MNTLIVTQLPFASVDRYVAKPASRDAGGADFGTVLRDGMARTAIGRQGGTDGVAGAVESVAMQAVDFATAGLGSSVANETSTDSNLDGASAKPPVTQLLAQMGVYSGASTNLDNAMRGGANGTSGAVEAATSLLVADQAASLNATSDAAGLGSSSVASSTSPDSNLDGTSAKPPVAQLLAQMGVYSGASTNLENAMRGGANGTSGAVEAATSIDVADQAASLNTTGDSFGKLPITSSQIGIYSGPPTTLDNLMAGGDSSGNHLTNAQGYAVYQGFIVPDGQDSNL